MAQAQSARAINPSGKKRSVTYSTDRENEVSKRYISSGLSKIFVDPAFPGLTLSGSAQPGPGAPLLGFAKCIH